MADDLDDLLNEVETNYCGKRGVGGRKSAAAAGTGNSNALSKSTGAKSGMKDIIDDILEDDPKERNIVRSRSLPTKTHPEYTQGAATGMGQKKCFPVFIGGSITPQGLATAVQKRACDHMGCTDCDFAVSSFNDFQWKSNTDYLFLRNNMPDFHRLSSKLIPKKGSRAYACQCKWKSVSGLEEVESSYKWVCRKH